MDKWQKTICDAEAKANWDKHLQKALDTFNQLFLVPNTAEAVVFVGKHSMSI